MNTRESLEKLATEASSHILKNPTSKRPALLKQPRLSPPRTFEAFFH
jgi:hypothetical protein